MSGSFPASIPDWSNLQVIRRNTLPPRSYFFLYTSEADALNADTTRSCSLSLNGVWKFHYSVNPFDAPQDFHRADYDVSSWLDIQVPGIWQLQGWGRPHYTNVPYPFFVDPPNVPYNDNQTGSYVRTFVLPADFQGQQLRLRFEGVDSAFHVFVNGQEIGYSQGARNPSEFDITSVVNFDHENTLAVRVYQYSDGSYLEDQDQWRFSGIFRDVVIHAFPVARLQDFQVQTSLDSAYQDAELQVRCFTVGEEDISIKLLDQEGRIMISETRSATGQDTTFQVSLSNPNKWTAETPYLYKLVLAFGGRYVPQNVGFRKIEIRNGLYLVNGKRIVFRGANRHEHHPEHGRAVPYEFMRRDLLLMKRHNINAIRTCHQPTDPRFYALADELGFWVMDEADVECHGFSTIDEVALPYQDKLKSFEERKALVCDKSLRFTSDNPEWKEHYVDRAVQLVMRDKNHPCIVMWSLGNEAFYGCNFQSMYDTIKAIDTTRPIHYEGDFEAKTADLFSMMYPYLEDMIEFAQQPNFSKPLVLCEYVHAMGNGPGNIKEYIDAFYKYPRLQGGWVWEWANHGLKHKDSRTGDEFYAYGGDFGDEPNDYNFIMDGVLFSDHSPTPGLIEYQKAIEPVQVCGHEDGIVTIVNRRDVTNLDYLECEMTIVADGTRRLLGQVAVPSDISPHTTAELIVPKHDDVSGLGETYLQLDFTLRESTKWASAGHLVASSQVLISPPTPSVPTKSLTSSPPVLTATASRLTIESATSKWVFALATGRLTSWRKNNVELIHGGLGPEMDFYRAMTDNDRPQDGWDWKEKLIGMAKSHTRSVKWSTNTDTGNISVVVSSASGPPTLSWSIDTVITYTFHASGSLDISCAGTPRGMNLPATLPRIGLTFAMPQAFDTVSWFGRGPGESYKDKKLSQHFGNWESRVNDLFTDYEFPQETSNRTDVRWVRLSAPSSSSVLPAAAKIPVVGDLLKPSHDAATSLTANFGTQDGFSFMISHYTTRDLDESTHPYQLHRKKKDFVIVRLDADHHGLGTGSCGPKTIPKYALRTRPFEFKISLA